MTTRLLVIISDRLSDLIRKGEVTPRYYNPGEHFDEVYILMTNDDRPDPGVLQRMVGRAKLFISNLPAEKRLFIRSLGWQSFLMRKWTERGLEIVKDVSPHLVRVYNNFKEGYLAYQIKKNLGIPYVVSLHGVWDKDDLSTFKNRMISVFRKRLERISLENSDHVIAVYQPILRYAREYGAKRVSLIYNVVSDGWLKEKKGYEIQKRPRIITVNRQLKEKNPESIIRAILDIDCEYTIVGDGPHHEYLETLAKRVGAVGKITFIKAIANEKLCQMLAEYDVMVSHCDYWGIPKSIIEASIVGLPIIMNQHPVEPIPEYKGGWLMLCKNTSEGYAEAIKRILGDSELRENMGKVAKLYAQNNWWPREMEEKVVSIYRELVNF